MRDRAPCSFPEAPGEEGPPPEPSHLPLQPAPGCPCKRSQCLLVFLPRLRLPTSCSGNEQPDGFAPAPHSSARGPQTGVAASPQAVRNAASQVPPQRLSPDLHLQRPQGSARPVPGCKAPPLIEAPRLRSSFPPVSSSAARSDPAHWVLSGTEAKVQEGQGPCSGPMRVRQARTQAP